MFPDQLNYYTEGYHTFGNTQVAASKFLWDTLYYWRVYAHAFMTGVFDDFGKLEIFEKYAKRSAELNRAVQKQFKELADSTPNVDHFDYTDLARKELFIESAISLLTKPSDAQFERHFEEQLKFLSQLQQSLQAELTNTKTQRTPFADFFGTLSNRAKLQNKYNRFVSRIRNGAFLYVVRDTYIDLIVRGKQRVHLSGMLRFLFPD